jgi:hypothetical protein
MNELTLDDIARKYGTDKSTLYHNYTPHYERLLQSLKDNDIHLLEIGVRQGWSHQMWHEYFKCGKIFGIDNCLESEFNSDHSHLIAKNITIFYGNQEDKKIAEDIKDYLFDIIIDDGGHKMIEHQLSLLHLIDKVKPGGLYFIEDLHTCSSPVYYTPGLFPQDSTIDFLHALNNEDVYQTSFINVENFQYIKTKIKSVEFLSNSLAVIYIK